MIRGLSRLILTIIQECANESIFVMCISWVWSLAETKMVCVWMKSRIQFVSMMKGSIFGGFGFFSLR